MKKKIELIGLRCVARVSLLGHITPNVRAIDVDWDAESITLFFYYEFQPSEDEVEESEIVSTEVLASYVDFEVNVERSIVPMGKVLSSRGFRLYQRKEKFTEFKEKSLLEVIFSLQVAILGQITPNLRLLTVDWNEKEITIYLTYEFAPSNDDNEASEIIARRVSADLNMPVILERSVVPMTKLFNRIGQWIYHRMEHIDESIKE